MFKTNMILTSTTPKITDHETSSPLINFEIKFKMKKNYEAR